MDDTGGVPAMPPKSEKSRLVTDEGPTLGGTDGTSSPAAGGASCADCMRPRLDLLPFKVFFLSFFGAIGALMPYLAVYFKQMGLGPEQIGLISGIRPLAGFCSGPFWGAVADRFHVRRMVLLVSMVAWIAFYLGLGFVPSAPLSGTCPKALLSASTSVSRRSVSPSAAPVHPHQHQRPTTFLNHSSSVSALYREDIAWMYEQAGLTRVFVSFLLLILLGELFQSPTSALADAGILEHLGEGNMVQYGRQRAWGSVGFGLCSFVVGLLVSRSRRDRVVCGLPLVFSNYTLPFYVFSALMMLAFISAIFFKFQGDKDHKSSVRQRGDGGASGVTSDPLAVFRIFLSLHHGSWLGAAYFMGVSNGIIWGFLYWHLENLGASQLLMGVASAVCCLSEFVMFYFVHGLIRLLGYMGVLYFGLFCYGVRFCVYAVIVNPWYVLPAEILQGITFASVWVSMTAYSTMAVPACSLGTIQGVMHGVYWGLGSGTGHMLGGLLISNFGAPITFLAFAVASILVLIVFVCVQAVSRRPSDYKDINESVTVNEKRREKTSESDPAVKTQ